MKDDISQFFNDINLVLKKSEEVVQSKDNKTNVIYLTTDCNLDCKYCYERDYRNASNYISKNCTEQDIDLFIKEIENREDGKSSTIVIMGGEPFLYPKKISYIIDVIINSKKSGGYGVCLITNGTLLRSNIDLIKEWKDKFKSAGYELKIEISYDGSGHSERSFKSGDSSKLLVEQNLTELVNNEIRFTISYTVHKSNFDKVYSDIIQILSTYRKFLDSISLSISYTDIDKSVSNSQDYLRKLKYGLQIIYQKFNIPICQFTCSLCQKCNFDNFNGNSYLSPTKGVLYADKRTEKPFDQF